MELLTSLAALGGFVIGLIVMLAMRRQTEQAAEPEPVDDALPPGVASVLAVLPSSAVVLEYHTSAFSFLAPSKIRACRSGAGNFASAVNAASRFCACADTAMPSVVKRTSAKDKRFISDTNLP